MKRHLAWFSLDSDGLPLIFKWMGQNWLAHNLCCVLLLNTVLYSPIDDELAMR